MIYDDETGPRSGPLPVFGAASACIGVTSGIDGSGDPVASGLVTVRFAIPGVSLDGTGGMRQVEAEIAALVLDRLNGHDALLRERDALRDRLARHDRSTAGFSTAELMWRAENGG